MIRIFERFQGVKKTLGRRFKYPLSPYGQKTYAASRDGTLVNSQAFPEYELIGFPGLPGPSAASGTHGLFPDDGVPERKRYYTFGLRFPDFIEVGRSRTGSIWSLLYSAHLHSPDFRKV